MYDYSGAIHVHSKYSHDGTTSMQEIIAAAQRQKLDFVAITDHAVLDARCDGWEGWHNNLLVIVGEEISPRYNHYLALNIATPVVVDPSESDSQTYIDAVAAQGGFGLIAHPDHTGAPKFNVKEYTWKQWSVHGYTGMSIWDFMTDWQSSLTSLPAAIKSFLFPSDVLAGPRPVTLERWDTLARERPALGYGEIDNHATRRSFCGLTLRVFPFDYAFSSIRTHVLLERELSHNATEAMQSIFDALKSCSAYVSHDHWHDPRGFDVCISEGGRSAGMGGSFSLEGKKAHLEATVPIRATIRVIRNGECILQTVDTADINAIISDPGLYRVEVYQKIGRHWRPWIYSNHIRVS